jgi:hypothetical protein
MLIKTTRHGSDFLQLDAYTFSEREWAALQNTMKRLGADTGFSQLNRDEVGREGRRFYLKDVTTIDALQSLLRGRFDTTGQFEPEPGAGKRYACSEVIRTGMGSGCEEFAASDDDTAVVSCGIIAGRNNWLGGDAKQGSCG